MARPKEEGVRVLAIREEGCRYVASTRYYCSACGSQDVWAEVTSGGSMFAPHGAHTGQYCCLKCSEFWHMDVMPDHEVSLSAHEVRTALKMAWGDTSTLP